MLISKNRCCLSFVPIFRVLSVRARHQNRGCLSVVHSFREWTAQEWLYTQLHANWRSSKCTKFMMLSGLCSQLAPLLSHSWRNQLMFKTELVQSFFWDSTILQTTFIHTSTGTWPGGGCKTGTFQSVHLMLWRFLWNQANTLYVYFGWIVCFLFIYWKPGPNMPVMNWHRFEHCLTAQNV